MQSLQSRPIATTKPLEDNSNVVNSHLPQSTMHTFHDQTTTMAALANQPFQEGTQDEQQESISFVEENAIYEPEAIEASDMCSQSIISHKHLKLDLLMKDLNESESQRLELQEAYEHLTIKRAIERRKLEKEASVLLDMEKYQLEESEKIIEKNMDRIKLQKQTIKRLHESNLSLREEIKEIGSILKKSQDEVKLLKFRFSVAESRSRHMTKERIQSSTLNSELDTYLKAAAIMNCELLMENMTLLEKCSESNSIEDSSGDDPKFGSSALPFGHFGRSLHDEISRTCPDVLMHDDLERSLKCPQGLWPTFASQSETCSEIQMDYQPTNDNVKTEDMIQTVAQTATFQQITPNEHMVSSLEASRPTPESLQKFKPDFDPESETNSRCEELYSKSDTYENTMSHSIPCTDDMNFHKIETEGEEPPQINPVSSLPHSYSDEDIYRFLHYIQDLISLNVENTSTLSEDPQLKTIGWLQDYIGGQHIDFRQQECLRYRVTELHGTLWSLQERTHNQEKVDQTGLQNYWRILGISLFFFVISSVPIHFSISASSQIKSFPEARVCGCGQVFKLITYIWQILGWDKKDVWFVPV
ncbi:hypothetical protein BGZ46_007087 [Entomortierella lignicola]|nr:hypothetical protein BGZ46_007087 [Entomortierella lignicola]